MTNRARKVVCFRSDNRARLPYLHQRCCRTDGKLNLDVNNLIGGEIQSAALICGETFAADTNAISSNVEVRDIEDTGRTGCYTAGGPGSFVHHLDVGCRHQRAGRIFYGPRNRSERTLSETQRSQPQTCNSPGNDSL